MATTSNSPSRSTQLKYAAARKCQLCGRAKPTSQTLCRNCLAKHNHASNSLKLRLIDEGRCAWCGGANKSGYRTCDDCRAVYNERRRTRK